MQGVKDKATSNDSRDKPYKDSLISKQMTRFSGNVSLNKADKKRQDCKLKQAEESLRTVIYLSCWGLN
ncbi:hypothetical protein MANES_12G082200v8 [Manihot esculenta]|uniref:Uncharacterized protein n=1 Tax=Manihot esculenta TaxID=3983 RepID=A0A2C9UUR0_MANES|nr:hypothetical protein MANES_12G082200v8 [Manihot esculenta]